MGEDSNARREGVENRCGVAGIRLLSPLILLAVLLLVSCTTTRYQRPEMPLTLFADGWPVGIWKNEVGSIMELYTDGTGKSINRVKRGKDYDDVVNTHLTWRYEGGVLKVERWIVSPNENTATFENHPAQAILEIKAYLARIQDKQSWIFPVNPGSTSLPGRYEAIARSFSWDGRGHINRIEYKGIRSQSTTYELVKLTATEFWAKQQREKQESLERATQPADLVMDVRFMDSDAFLPNSSLDAGEVAEVIVSVKNRGKGMGFDTTLDVAADKPGIAFEKMVTIGNIQPGETKEVKVRLKAGLDLPDGTAAFSFSLKERRGYDAKRVVLNVPMARLEKPMLTIVSSEINDGDTGLAKGNGNGIPESGETIELTVLIKNEGVGKAIGVNLAGMDVTGGIQWVRDSTLVGTIQPGETAKAKLAFAIPRNFEGNAIATNLKVADIRGVSDAGKAVSCAFSRRSPNLQYAWKIYEKGVPVTSVVNGGEYELEMNVSNNGQIAARDVSVALSAAGITLGRTRIDAGEIKEGTAYPAQRIAMSIPRTFTDHQIPLDVRISQADFGQAASSLSIPVQVKGPKLRYVGSVTGRHGNNTLEQGEPGVLEIAVYNDGNLRAEGVTVRVESRDDNLKIQGTKDVLVGNIPSNTRSETIKFQLSTLRAIKVGGAPLDVHVGQTDFPSINTQYVLNIAEEAATVVDVAAEDRGKGATRVRAGSGPSIAFMSAPGGLATSEETFRLAFDVKDTRNIERIDVTVNGIRQPLTEKDGMTPAASKSKQVIKNIRLNEGENRIVVTAYNVDNLSARKEMIVNRTGEEDVDTPVVTGMNNPNGVAVVIGVSKYENPNIPSVDYARRDAMKIREYLVKTMGYKEGNILELYDEKATVSKIKNTLNRELKSRVTPNSDVFVYFSGHGLPETNANEPYLTTYDVVPENPGDTAYSMKDFYSQLESLKARNVTVVIDACFSGMTDSDTKRIIPLIRSASPAFMEVTNPLLKIRNGVVFTSSKGKQISSWYHKKQHGLFTYYFLQGLRGKADFDGSGVITAKGMERYLIQSVPNEAMKQHGREQMPEVMGNKDMILVKLR